jgi:delta 1-pyrroline-5-carboxylate dehydrogenase
MCVATVASDSEALSRACTGPYGLGVTIFSRDEAAARSVADRVVAGVVVINDMIVPTADPRLPFGGRKLSGYGVTRGAEGLLEMTVPKVITVRFWRQRPHFIPLKDGDAELFKQYLALAHGRGIRSRLHAMVGLARTLARRRQGAATRT